MRIIDLTSLIDSGLTAKEILAASYVVQETEQSHDNIFFVDKKKVSDNTLASIQNTISPMGLSLLISNTPLFSLISNELAKTNAAIEIVSNDYIALSKLSKGCTVWDLTTLKKYTVSEFSEQLLEFPHDRLGLFACLTNDKYHNLNTNTSFTTEQAIELCKTYPNIQSLIQGEQGGRLSTKIEAVKSSLPDIASKLKSESATTSFLDYITTIPKPDIDEPTHSREENGVRVFELTNPVHVASACSMTLRRPDTPISMILGDTFIAIKHKSNIIISRSTKDRLGMDELFNLHKNLFQDSNIKVYCESAKDFFKALAKRGINPTCQVLDISLGAYTIDTHNKNVTLNNASSALALQDATLSSVQDQIQHIERVCEHINDELTKSSKINIYNKIELKFSSLIVEMEECGVRINTGKLFNIQSQLEASLNAAREEVQGYTKTLVVETNTNCIASILYDELGIKSGSRSVAQDHLQELYKKTGHAILPALMKLRKLSDLFTGQISTLHKHISSHTGHIHSTVNQNHTKTGRISVSSPNYQGFEKLPDMPQFSIRGVVEPSLGSSKKLVAIDYSQMELKILAHLSGEKFLIDAFNNGTDIHTATASRVFGKKLAEVTEDERRSAKAINFGIIYGMTSFGLAKRMDCSEKDASAFIERYFNALPRVKKFLDYAKKYAEENGYVKTIIGRPIYIKNINSKIPSEKNKALRAASNAPMQGSASDIIKLAMINASQAIKDKGLAAKIIMQVHDEMIFEVEDKHLSLAVKVVKEAMEGAVDLRVRLDTDVCVGSNWGNMDDYTIEPVEDTPQPS